MIRRMLFSCVAFVGLAADARAVDVSTHKPDATAQPPAKARPKLARHAPYRECCGEGYRFVYAESWYSSQKVVAPVRRVPGGDQVLLPNGPWVDCVLSCEYTLRKQTLSFWQGQGPGPGDQVPPVYPRSNYYIDGWGQKRGYLF